MSPAKLPGDWLRVSQALAVGRSPFFDRAHYEAEAGRRFRSDLGAALHYVLRGEATGLRPSRHFDPAAYRARYRDLAGHAGSLLEHYDRHGFREGRGSIFPAPHPTDAAWHGIVEKARREGPPDAIAAIARSPHFDPAFYQAAAAAPFASAEHAAAHYYFFGEAAGLRPSRSFDPAYYRARYPDLAGFEQNLLLHFSTSGAAETRVGAIDLDSYLAEPQPTAPVHVRRLCVITPADDLAAGDAPARALIHRLSRVFGIVLASIGEAGAPPPDASLEAVLAIPAETFVSAPDHRSALRLVQDLAARFAPDAMLVLGARFGILVEIGARLGMPVVAMVEADHAEIASAKTFLAPLLYTNRVIFPSRLALTAAEQRRAEGPIRTAIVEPFEALRRAPPRAASEGDIALGDLLGRLARRKLILGFGRPTFAQGIDLFLATAEQAARRDGAATPFFLWLDSDIGDPADRNATLIAADRIARMGQAGYAGIFSSGSALSWETLLGRADAVFLSARAGPCPALAIDALRAGVPVVSFADATGLDALLAGLDQAAALVVPRPEAGAALEALDRALTQDRWRRPSRALIAFAQDRPWIAALAHTLAGAVEAAIAEARSQAEDIALLRAENAVAPEMLGSAHIPRGFDPTAWYVRTAATGLHRLSGVSRRPALGFSPNIYEAHADGAPERPALADYVRNGRPDGPWRHDCAILADRGAVPAPAGAPIGLHLHLHHHELVDEIIDRLLVNAAPYDLLVSVTSEAGYRHVRERLAARLPAVACLCRIVENRGRDIAAFLTAFREALLRYEIVGHIHGKRSTKLSGPDADRWRLFLLEHLVGGRRDSLDQILARFRAEPDLGLVFAEDPNLTSWTANRDEARALLARMGVAADLSDDIEFPNGNMFLARTEALRPLFELGLRVEDYPAEPVAYDGTMLHAAERITPILARERGFRVLTVHAPGVER